MAGYWGSAGEVSMRHAAAIALMMSLPFAAAMADVYRSVDAQGHVQYSDTPSPGAQLVTNADETPSPSSADVDRSAAQAQKVNEQIHDRVAHETAAEQTAKDTAAAHE